MTIFLSMQPSPLSSGAFYQAGQPQILFYQPLSLLSARMPQSLSVLPYCLNLVGASGTPSKDATFALQFLFTIFVGCQGIMIFILYGIRKVEAQNEWKRWFSAMISWLPCGQLSGNKTLDSTASPFKSHATFSSRSKYISKTGTLPTDTSFENKILQLETNATTCIL